MRVLAVHVVIIYVRPAHEQVTPLHTPARRGGMTHVTRVARTWHYI